MAKGKLSTAMTHCSQERSRLVLGLGCLALERLGARGVLGADAVHLAERRALLRCARRRRLLALHLRVGQLSILTLQQVQATATSLSQKE